jgi:hypothetical protein
VRNGAAHFACPEHGRFSVRTEKVGGEEHEVAVFQYDATDAFWRLGESL